MLKPYSTLEDHNDYVRAIDYSPSGKLYSASDDGEIKIWDLNFFDCAKTFHVDHIPGITCAYILFNE